MVFLELWWEAWAHDLQRGLREPVVLPPVKSSLFGVVRRVRIALEVTAGESGLLSHIEGGDPMVFPNFGQKL